VDGEAHQAFSSVILVPFVEKIGGAELRAEYPSAARELVILADVFVADGAFVKVRLVLPDRALLALMHPRTPSKPGEL
jgi:hypothetical protein